MRLLTPRAELVPNANGSASSAAGGSGEGERPRPRGSWAEKPRWRSADRRPMAPEPPSSSPMHMRLCSSSCSHCSSMGSNMVRLCFCLPALAARADPATCPTMATDRPPSPPAAAQSRLSALSRLSAESRSGLVGVRCCWSPIGLRGKLPSRGSVADESSVAWEACCREPDKGLLACFGETGCVDEPGGLSLSSRIVLGRRPLKGLEGPSAEVPPARRPPSAEGGRVPLPASSGSSSSPASSTPAALAAVATAARPASACSGGGGPKPEASRGEAADGPEGDSPSAPAVAWPWRSGDRISESRSKFSW
mmetsp:Transcript_107051/g.341607  ORF Transcript_107051/g.341607 Transcript_107051/m.341607 type:complete len:308 (+) Transcript_107051:741-1664(+)